MKTSETNISTLIKKLDTPGDKAAEKVIQRLVRIGSPAVPALLKAAKSKESPRIRKWSLQALGAIGDKRAATVLVRALQDERMTVRLHALRGLGRMRYKKGARAIAALLNDESGGIRLNALQVLMEIGNASAGPQIQKALSDQKWYVRKMAAAACEKLGINSAVESRGETMAMNPEVTQFVKSAKQWQAEIKRLRAILLETPLEEELKWRQPCYTYQGSNVAIIQPFKRCLALMFFKGALLKDTKNLLIANGLNSQSPMRLEFTSEQEITKLHATIQSYVKEAIALEKSGKKVEVKRKPEPMPAELKKALAGDPKLKKAFEALTPGRQRGYILHISSAKQSATRMARIEKSTPKILKGKGFNER